MYNAADCWEYLEIIMVSTEKSLEENPRKGMVGNVKIPGAIPRKPNGRHCEFPME